MADRKDLRHEGDERAEGRSLRNVRVPVWAARVLIAAIAAAISAFGLFSFDFGQGIRWQALDPGGPTMGVLAGFALASIAAIRPAVGANIRFKAFTAAVIIALTLKDLDSLDAVRRALVSVLVMLAVIAATKLAADRWRARSSRPKRPAAPAVAAVALVAVFALPIVTMVAGAGSAVAQSNGAEAAQADACRLLDDVEVVLGDETIGFAGSRKTIEIEDGDELDIYLRHGGTDAHVTVHISLIRTRWIPLPFALPELVYTGEVLPGQESERTTYRVVRDGPFDLQGFAVLENGEPVASGEVRAFSGVGTFEVTAIASSGTECSRTIDLRFISAGWQTPDSLVSVGLTLLGSGMLAGLATAGPPPAQRRASTSHKPEEERRNPTRPGVPPRISKISAGTGANAKTYAPDQPVQVDGETRLEIEFKPVGEDEEEIERHLRADGTVEIGDVGRLISEQFSMTASAAGAPILVGLIDIDASIDDDATLRLLVLDQEILVCRAAPAGEPDAVDIDLADRPEDAGVER